jgi:hypothetical protein
MIQRKVLLLFAAVAVQFVAAKPLGFMLQLTVVDRLSKIAASESPAKAGLVALEQIASGRPEAVDASLAVTVGIKQDIVELSWLRASEVRAHAMRKIGETGRQEAIAFLSGLKKADFDSDTTGQIWPESRVALKQAEFLNIDNRPQRIEFLENLLRTSGGSIVSWAVDELCSLGSLPSTPLIAGAFRRIDPGQQGEELIRFAEARMRVVMSDPDRVKALSTALKISGDPDDLRLAQWAIEELVPLHTPEADAALDKYSAAISALPRQSKERQSLYFLPDTIHELRQRP